ncbi:hypothetical protein Pisl_0151 [Pyrobaculum islandicum DSM 4184]|uniref:Uncharacterized protein n=1 Tax=Pyrobaculum islandicum (strain DSM 4184 / JCM 9189 / GEO3) TaxID=384616 RepID=A1RQV2_PYRIL|nr:hypothetical protein Pisl_0151 [Pyrobaculum islandicum DSM 4184]
MDWLKNGFVLWRFYRERRQRRGGYRRYEQGLGVATAAYDAGEVGKLLATALAAKVMAMPPNAALRRCSAPPRRAKTRWRRVDSTQRSPQTAAVVNTSAGAAYVAVSASARGGGGFRWL